MLVFLYAGTECQIRLQPWLLAHEISVPTGSSYLRHFDDRQQKQASVSQLEVNVSMTCGQQIR